MAAEEAFAFVASAVVVVVAGVAADLPIFIIYTVHVFVKINSL